MMKSSVRTHRAFHHSDCAGNLTGTQASGTNIYMAGRTINHCLDALDIGLPSAIRAPMGVRDLNAEGNALVAELAFSHPLHLLAAAYFKAFTGTANILTEMFSKSKKNFQKSSSFLGGLPVGKVLRNLLDSYIMNT